VGKEEKGFHLGANVLGRRRLVDAFKLLRGFWCGGKGENSAALKLTTDSTTDGRWTSGGLLTVAGTDAMPRAMSRGMQQVTPSRRAARAIKRALDVGVASAGLLGLSPVLVALIGAELWFHGWPPIFTQRRPGLNGRVFAIYKFRTMTDERDPHGALLPDDRRLTRFGTWLRASSLDELPELLNVLRGEMSLVGPRPLLVKYLELYSPEQARRHEMRPGITGWAQVNGRNGCSWEEKLARDVWYVDNWSLGLDLRILARTALTVLRREGISAAGAATMPEYRGASAMNERPDGGNESLRSLGPMAGASP
jgi:lipopolysaccharide/colanic/teichoic acid biosynthesis glycosyltransferase